MQQSQDTILENEEAEPELDSDAFCCAYYQVKYKELRLEVIRETFRDLTGKWDRNFVIYPISG